MEKEHQTFLEFCNRNNWPSHEDEVLLYANDRFHQWINQFDLKEKDVILEMINEFSYFSREVVTNNLADLSSVLEKDFSILNNAVYTYIKKNSGKICSSVDYWIDYRRRNKLASEYFIDDLDSFPNSHWSKVENIVIIDDCCNSGGSLEKFIKQCSKDFKGKNLYYVVICAMQDAFERVKGIAAEYNLNIILIAKAIMNKAFSIEKIRNIYAAEAFENFSVDLGIPKDFCLGFSNSQSLMAFYNNTPNNTIGVFWHKTTKNEPIFVRRERAVPLWEMKEAKKERAEENYCAGTIKGKYE